MQSDLEALKQSRYFRSLPAESLADLATHVRHRSLEAGEVLFEQGDSGIAMFIVSQGEIKISVQTPNKPEVALAMLGPGQAFGEMALFDDNERRSATATASVPTTLLYVNRDDFLGAVNREPAALRAVLSSLADDIRTMNKRLTDIVTLDANARMGQLFLDDLAAYHLLDEKTGHITINRVMSTVELGSRVYMHPTHVETRIRDYMYERILSRDLEGRLVILEPTLMAKWR